MTLKQEEVKYNESNEINILNYILMKKILLLAFLLCAFIQANATEWTDSNGNTWSFTVNGTEATDIRFLRGPNSEMIYLYGDPNRSEEEKAEDPQEPFKPGAWDAAAMRFSSTEGSHFPTIPDEVYFGLKTLIFDVSDVSDDFDLKVMNGWWSNTYYDHVKWVDGLNELPITQTMADECAKGGEGRDLDLMLYSGSVTIKSVYYESYDVSGAVVIPAKVYVGSAELTVTSIGSSAFYNCSGLTNVDIPSSVTSIGYQAFYKCSGLTSVTIPNSVTSIGDWAFSGCSSLTSVTIPNSVTSIGNSAFSGCSGLTSMTIPSTVTSIGSSAFFGCSGLTSVTIPNSVTSIGDYAFGNCSGLTSVTIPEGVTSISNSTFSYCSGLTSVTIPNSVTSIGDWAFSGCSSLTSVTIPNSVTSIGDWAFSMSGLTSMIIPNSVKTAGVSVFAYCYSLTSVTIGNGVESIGDWAFNYCYRLTSVTIPNSVTTIGFAAFVDCSSLTSVTIPNSVTTIGGGAFSRCSNLTSVISQMKNPCTIDYDCFDDDVFTNSTLYVPEGTITRYYNTDYWYRFKNIVEGEPTGIDNASLNDVKIQAHDGFVSVSGMGDSERVAIYQIDGKQVATAKAYNGRASVATNISKGSAVIVKIGDKTVKVVMQ